MAPGIFSCFTTIGAAIVEPLIRSAGQEAIEIATREVKQLTQKSIQDIASSLASIHHKDSHPKLNTCYRNNPHQSFKGSNFERLSRDSIALSISLPELEFRNIDPEQEALLWILTSRVNQAYRAIPRAALNLVTSHLSQTTAVKKLSAHIEASLQKSKSPARVIRSTLIEDTFPEVTERQLTHILDRGEFPLLLSRSKSSNCSITLITKDGVHHTFDTDTPPSKPELSTRNTTTQGLSSSCIEAIQPLLTAFSDNLYQWKEGFIEVDFAGNAGTHKIQYFESGNPHGIPMILCHGGPGWKPAHQNNGEYTYFNPETYRIISFSQPGCGGSIPSITNPAVSLSPHFDHLGTDEMVHTVLALKQALGIKKRALLSGFSWGATLSFLCLLKYPQDFYGAITGSSFIGSNEELSDFYSGKLVRKLDSQFLINETGDLRIKAWQQYCQYPSKRLQFLAEQNSPLILKAQSSGSLTHANQLQTLQRKQITQAHLFQNMQDVAEGKTLLTENQRNLIIFSYPHLNESQVLERPWLLLFTAYKLLLNDYDDRNCARIWEGLEEFITGVGSEQLEASQKIDQAFYSASHHSPPGLPSNLDYDRSQTFWQLTLFPQLPNLIDMARSGASGFVWMVHGHNDTVCPQTYAQKFAETLYQSSSSHNLTIKMIETDGSHARGTPLMTDKLRAGTDLAAKFYYDNEHLTPSAPPWFKTRSMLLRNNRTKVNEY